MNIRSDIKGACNKRDSGTVTLKDTPDKRMYRQRMEKEMRLLQDAPGPGVSCWRHQDQTQLQELRAQIIGPEDTPYADGVFLLSISIPDRYPFEPPHVRFLTPVYHPNIDSDGRICLDTLKMQPQGSWAPAVNLNTLLLTIRVLLAYPNPADGLVADITEQYKRDITSFRADARRWTLKHAVASGAGRGAGAGIVSSPGDVEECVGGLREEDKKTMESESNKPENKRDESNSCGGSTGDGNDGGITNGNGHDNGNTAPGEDVNVAADNSSNAGSGDSKNKSDDEKESNDSDGSDGYDSSVYSSSSDESGESSDGENSCDDDISINNSSSSSRSNDKCIISAHPMNAGDKRRAELGAGGGAEKSITAVKRRRL